MFKIMSSDLSFLLGEIGSPTAYLSNMSHAILMDYDNIT